MYTLYLNEEEKGVWEYEIFTALAEYLETSLGEEVALRHAEAFAVKSRLFFKENIELAHNMAVLQHRYSRAYWVIEGNDWVTPFTVDIRKFTRDRRCRGVLKCQYKSEPYREPPLTKIRPWTYFETHAREFQSQLQELRRIEKTRSPLFFRGNHSWAERGAILKRLDELDLINKDFADWVSYEAHSRELAEYKIILALEGMGKLCHREIEAFGVGTPVLSPFIDIELHEPLIPDHHYIQVEETIHTHTPEEVADALARRYREVIDDETYLDFVGRNAMAWYDANVRQPQSLKLAARIMGLES